EQCNCHQADHQHIECAQAVMHQHLVDYYLKEQRRDEGKDLKKERCDQYLGEQVPVFVDSSQEPGQVEATREVRQGRSASDQNNPAVPDSFELSTCHCFRSWRRRVLNEDFVLDHFTDDKKTTVAQHRDRWQWRGGKPLPLSRGRACLEPEFFGTTQHF